MTFSATEPPVAAVRGAHRSSAIPLALLYGALIVYASLYPFADGSWPGHLGLLEILHLPLPPWRIPFDMAANLLGYMPLGFLIYVAGVRSRYHPAPVALLACVAPSALSYAMEVTQQFLPGRYPSALDWILNSAGAVLGTLVAAILQALTLIDRWAAARDRWFWRRSRGALVLMLLWPVGLLFPAPLPLAMGPSWERIQDGLVDWLLDVPWAQTALEWVSDIPVPEDRLPVPVEVLGTALGLLAPCLLAYAVTRPGWRRVVLAVGALCVGLCATTLSAALNFGPAHAWAWMSPGVPSAVVMGSVLAVVLLPVPQRLAAALGMAVLCLQTVLVLQSPSDPYYAFSLQSWEQGQFIRFHGLAQWVGWLWPLATLLWLAVRLASAERMPPLRRRGGSTSSAESEKSDGRDA